MNMLKNDIETCNPIKLKMTPKWLTKQTMSDDKTHTSIVITLNTAMKAQLCKNGLFIEGIKVKTNMFKFIKSSHQCEKYMKFEHAKTDCKNVITCNFYSLTHDTNNHKCNKYNVIRKICIYINFKCVNCNENHCANNKNCKIVIFMQFKKPIVDNMMNEL